MKHRKMVKRKNIIPNRAFTVCEYFMSKGVEPLIMFEEVNYKTYFFLDKVWDIRLRDLSIKQVMWLRGICRKFSTYKNI